jgi:hypothetical protein
VDFFDFYRSARLITKDTPEVARLQIHIDYHSGAGCIANSTLHTTVDSEGEVKRCCWPATSTHYRTFGAYD